MAAFPRTLSAQLGFSFFPPSNDLLSLLESLPSADKHAFDRRASTFLLRHEALVSYLDCGEVSDHFAQQQADVWIQLSQQETFLRNMALVALMSRLTHSLLGTLRSGAPWAPRVPGSYSGQDEFKKIWADLRSRFSLVLSTRYIGWIEPYRRARNLIVHNGAKLTR